MKKALIFILSSLLVCVGGFMGIFSAAGLLVMIWGKNIIELTVYDDGGMLVFIVALVTMLIGIYIGCMGMIYGVVCPVCKKLNLNIKSEGGDDSTKKL